MTATALNATALEIDFPQLRVERTQFDFVAAESLRSDGAHKDFLKLAALFSSPAIFGLGIDTPADEAIGGYA